MASFKRKFPEGCRHIDMPPLLISRFRELLNPHQPSSAVEIATICPSGVRCTEVSRNSPHSWHSSLQTKANVGSDLSLNTEPLCSPQAPHALLVFNNISPRPANWLPHASESAQFTSDVPKCKEKKKERERDSLENSRLDAIWASMFLKNSQWMPVPF